MANEFPERAIQASDCTQPTGLYSYGLLCMYYVPGCLYDNVSPLCNGILTFKQFVWLMNKNLISLVSSKLNVCVLWCF
jgi:hypothetical protein